MNQTLKNLLVIALVIITSGFAGRALFPVKVTEIQKIPTIVTTHDTVERLPSWFADSVRIWKKRKTTTDTVNIVYGTTHVDTEYVRVPCDTAQRSNIRPVLSYHGSAKLGDTASVATFSLKNGSLDLSRVYIPGILVGIDADSTPTPRLTFEPFPKPKGPSLLYRLKLLGIGFASGTVACAAYNTSR